MAGNTRTRHDRLKVLIECDLSKRKTKLYALGKGHAPHNHEDRTCRSKPGAVADRGWGNMVLRVINEPLVHILWTHPGDRAGPQTLGGFAWCSSGQHRSYRGERMT